MILAKGGSATTSIHEFLRRHRFIVPCTGGPITGGTLFNRELIRALIGLGEDAAEVGHESWQTMLNAPEPSTIWVDSLYAHELPNIAEACPERHRVGLIVHFLASLFEHPTPMRVQVTDVELAALDCAERFLVTSEYMAGIVRSVISTPRRVLVVEPGCLAGERAPRPACSETLRAVMVANLLENKGVLPFLQELSNRVSQTDSFTLRVVGNHELASSYALECERVAATPLLQNRVELLGERPPEDVIHLLSGSDLLVSASITESYGMALAEARTLGVPLLALAGGNVRSFVTREAGGELVCSHEELASAFLDLCRDAVEVENRAGAARKNAIAPRSWRAAARDYLRQMCS